MARAFASDVERICTEFRWQEEHDTNANAEKVKVVQQWEARSLTWSVASNGNTCIKLSLPPELAQAFLNSVEHSLSKLDSDCHNHNHVQSKTNMAAIRADAAVHMAEASLQNAGRDIATADRFQVTVLADASDLKSNVSASTASSSITPTKKPTILGVGPIAQEIARRIACDCSVSTITKTNGEPTDIGQKSRIWPAAMARAIKARDQHCQFPGCTMPRHLHIHHIKHWADGGSTCIENGVCLCSYHHTLVHEGGLRIERMKNADGAFNEQFNRQRETPVNADAHECEVLLRNSRESFNFSESCRQLVFVFALSIGQGVIYEMLT